MEGNNTNPVHFLKLKLTSDQDGTKKRKQKNKKEDSTPNKRTKGGKRELFHV